MFVFGHAGLSVLGYHLLGAGRTNASCLTRPFQLAAVVFFALLPDLVDKPLTLWALHDAISTRWFGHTLGFSLLVCTTAYFFLPSLKNWVWACPGHLLLDGMWRSPHTLLFPLLGWEMDPGTDPNISFWELLTGNIRRLLTEPDTAIPELAGLLILSVAVAHVGLWYWSQGRAPQSLARPHR